MRDLATLKRRYEQDEPAVQLGGLASNLTRIAWHAQHGTREAATEVFRESKYFTEWAVVNCSSEQQLLLSDIQVCLARWERGWGRQFDSSTVAREAQAWSERLLEASGLLTQ